MTSQAFLVRKIEASFDLFDADGDGALTENDHILMGQRAARELGHLPDSPKEHDAVAAFCSVWRELHLPRDTDGDGRIGRDEFVASTLALSADEALTHTTVGRIVDCVMDIMGRGENQEIGFAQYAAYVKSHGPGLSDDAIRQGFERIDADGNGHLSREELRQAVLDYFTSIDPGAAGNWFFGPPPGGSDA
jgi:Ca2+-binding EF-hand superfamily protein